MRNYKILIKEFTLICSRNVDSLFWKKLESQPGLSVVLPAPLVAPWAPLFIWGSLAVN